MRSRVEKSDALVDRVARRIKETREGGMPRGERRPGEQGAQDRRQIDAGQPDDADATATRCSGNGNDRIAVALSVVIAALIGGSLPFEYTGRAVAYLVLVLYVIVGAFVVFRLVAEG